MREDGYLQAMNFLSGAHQERVQFLKQLSEKDFWDYAEQMAGALPTHPGPDDHQSSDAYLVCDLGSVGCVLPLAELRAVVPAPTRFSLLPHTPAWMPGLAAWSNAVLAVVDLRAYLLQALPTPICSSTMLLITQHEDLFFGLLTPIVGTSPELEASHWQSLAQAETNYDFACPAAITGISLHASDVIGLEEKDLILLLDIPVMLASIVKKMRKMVVYG